MTDETVTIENLPNVRDINVLLNAIQELEQKSTESTLTLLRSMDHLSVILMLTMNISEKSEHLII